MMMMAVVVMVVLTGPCGEHLSCSSYSKYACIHAVVCVCCVCALERNVHNIHNMHAHTKNTSIYPPTTFSILSAFIALKNLC